MKTTLYTDASVDTHTRTGGWGMWAKSDIGRIVRGGVIHPKFCGDSTHAEMAAVFAGLHVVLRAWGDDLTEVLVRSDNNTVTRLLSSEGTRMRCYRRHPELKDLVDRITEKLGDKVRLIPAWVKGHQTGWSTPAYVNDECDRQARRYRQVASLNAGPHSTFTQNSATSPTR